MSRIKIGEKLKLLYIFLCFLAITEKSGAEESIFNLNLSMEVKDLRSCKIALSDFSKYCEPFSYVDRRLHPGQKDWSRGGFEYAWYDFDLDRKLDLYVRLTNADWCGTLGCPNYIIFRESLDQSSSRQLPVIYLAHSDGPIRIRMGDSVTVSFDGGAHELDINIEKSMHTRNFNYR